MMVDTVAINNKFALNMKMGPTFQTTVTPLSGGYEDRNQDWQIALWRYDCEFQNRDLSEMRSFMAHFLGRRGRANTFPLRDPLDNSLTDQNIGTGDGSTAAFQIRKTYSDTDRPYFRIITIVSSLVVKVNGVTKTNAVHYNEANGLVTFTGGNIPTAGQAITVSCDFLIRVRYDVDYNPLTLPIGPDTATPFASASFTLMEVLR